MIKYERVTVTPKLAAQWLEKNAENNRQPKKSRIPAMARDMLSGRWNENTGETIKFDTYGTLIDGQNRLRALALAGETDPNVKVGFDVARGLPSDAMRVIDSGAARTFADALGVEGVFDRNRVGSVVRWAINWDAGNYIGGGKLSPTNAELWDRYRTDADNFVAAAKRGSDLSTQRLGTAAVGGSAFYILARVDREATAAFFDRYVSGASLEQGSPILALRNRMSKARIDRVKRQEQMALTIKAWNQWRKGVIYTGRSGLLLPKGDLTNANFPKPE